MDQHAFSLTPEVGGGSLHERKTKKYNSFSFNASALSVKLKCLLVHWPW